MGQKHLFDANVAKPGKVATFDKRRNQPKTGDSKSIVANVANVAQLPLERATLPGYTFETAPRCDACGLTHADWHEPDARGVCWTVRLEEAGNGWLCTRCKETKEANNDLR